MDKTMNKMLQILTILLEIIHLFLVLLLSHIMPNKPATVRAEDLF